MNSGSGIESSFNRSMSSERPRFHVVSSVNTTAPMRSVNHPPSGILSEFDARNARSMARSGTAIASATGSGQFQSLRITTKISTESIIIASVTAIPYAPPRLSELLKPSTSSDTAIKSVQLTKGT
jgi:hypothetical protein